MRKGCTVCCDGRNTQSSLFRVQCFGPSGSWLVNYWYRPIIAVRTTEPFLWRSLSDLERLAVVDALCFAVRQELREQHRAQFCHEQCEQMITGEACMRAGAHCLRCLSESALHDADHGRRRPVRRAARVALSSFGIEDREVTVWESCSLRMIECLMRLWWKDLFVAGSWKMLG